MTIVSIRIIADINNGKIKSFGFMLRKPTREVRHKPMHKPSTSEFGCERAIHRFIVNTRADDVALKKFKYFLGVQFRCAIF